MIKKCLFPAAGYGTRFLPATKAVPKEMLPILTKPLLQYAVEEALSAGMNNMAVVTGKGRATDNICIERFWRSAKVERIYLNEYQNISELTTDVDDYIDFYNHRRFHETLDYKKPMDVYQESIKLNQNKKKVS